VLPRDVYHQPGAPDPILPADTVLRIVRRYVRSAAAVTAVDESGGEARAYAIDDAVILKTQRPQQLRARTSLEKEAVFLQALAHDPEVRVPRVLGYGRDGSIEYLCMTRMPGVAANTVAVAGNARGSLLRSLGRMLRRIHSLPQQQFHENPMFPGMRTTQEFEQRFRDGVSDAVAAIQAQPEIWTLATPPEAFAEAALAGLRSSPTLVALHSNPGPEHVFIDPRTHELNGLIDFGDAFISHPGFDWRWPLQADRLAILDGYADEGALDDDFMAQWRACLILSDLNAVATRPSRRTAALASLEQVARSGLV
jgi:hygromycin-B 7''-O-kinase